MSQDRNWKPETWEHKRKQAHEMSEATRKTLPYIYCAWWAVTDPITNMSHRAWRDFQTLDECKAFADNHEPLANFAHVKLLTWHPNNYNWQ